MRRLGRAFALFAVLALANGCAGPMVKLAPTPSEGFTTLGKVEGKSCGMIMILATAYNFIPAGLNGRTERAYQAALAQAPGATGLVEVTVSEDWVWLVIGTLRCVTVTGKAVK